MSFSTRAAFAFFAVVGAALCFALYTEHAWEDYWITFRSSRNFAEGNGLVYTPGERLHTFTSPLGVLLPALAYGLTLNSSDEAALWIFRVMSAAALGGAAILLLVSAKRMQYAGLAAAALVLFVATDAKILDFSINGMETGFLLLFLAWTWYGLTGRPSRPWLHLGLAWGGLMWTRPDSFIYIGALAAGVWLFNRPAETGRDRRGWVKVFAQAGMVTTAIYLPWLVAAHLYYGTPIPHTITAKGLSNAAVSLERIVDFVRQFPAALVSGRLSFDASFLPSYYVMGGWPAAAVLVARWIAIAVAFVWALPFVRWEARAASLAFLVGHLYLSFFPYFPFPWYLPVTTLLAFFVLASLLHQLSAKSRDHHRSDPSARALTLRRRLAGIFVSAFVCFSLALTVGSARQLAVAQEIVEEGTRKQIGLYLREHASPSDTVFLEPLGYIGYFSRLKMQDFPGLSSREMTAARQRVGSNWAALINFLQPTWLVLRDRELHLLAYSDAGIAAYRYQEERRFDTLSQVAAQEVPGRPYLEFDSQFVLLRKISPPAQLTSFGTVRGMFEGTAERDLYGTKMLIVHAPGEIVIEVPAGAREVVAHFCFDPAAYSDDNEKTDGARFSIHWTDGAGDFQIWTRHLSPAIAEKDRGLQTVTVNLDDLKWTETTRLILRTDPGPTLTRDWTAWSKATFR